MLIPDLLNIVFDQADYHTIITIGSFNKRRTNYATKYSVFRYYDDVHKTNKSTMDVIFNGGHLKLLKHIIGLVNDRNIGYVLDSCIGNMEMIKYLVSTELTNTIINNALRRSAIVGNLRLVKYFVSIGADVHTHDDDALRWSADGGHLNMVKFLVGIGADIHVWDDIALRWCKDLETVKYLVSVGANIHAEYDGALRRRALEGNLEVVKYLISVGAHVHMCNQAIMKQIAKNGHHEVIEYLQTCKQ